MFKIYVRSSRTEECVESAVHGKTALGVEAQVPLADHVGGVAQVTQLVRQEAVGQWVTLPVVEMKDTIHSGVNLNLIKVGITMSLLVTCLFIRPNEMDVPLAEKIDRAMERAREHALQQYQAVVNYVNVERDRQAVR